MIILKKKLITSLIMRIINDFLSQKVTLFLTRISLGRIIQMGSNSHKVFLICSSMF